MDWERFENIFIKDELLTNLVKPKLYVEQPWLHRVNINLYQN